MKPSSHWLFAAVSLTAAFFSFVLLAQALWIPAKAELAQWLIERSWRQLQAGQQNAPPWPWADTQPLGILSVPDFDIRQMILQGNSGRNLAFGPVLLDSSSQGADLIISGHRDTHFHFLQDLEPGDLVQIQLADAAMIYQVSQIEVIDSRQNELILDPGISRLSLVTCYPFDTLATGGPLRYVVTALPLNAMPPRYSPSSG